MRYFKDGRIVRQVATTSFRNSSGDIQREIGCGVQDEEPAWRGFGRLRFWSGDASLP